MFEEIAYDWLFDEIFWQYFVFDQTVNDIIQ